METMTWDDQGEGLYVPVHQEPADCPGGRQPERHSGDCGCSGTGFTFEGGYWSGGPRPSPGTANTPRSARRRSPPSAGRGLRWDTVLYGAILAWLGAAAADYLTGPSAPRPFTGLALRAYALASATLTALTV
ncbi:hypothetical protein ACFQ0T_38660 [Kitasatospora gansuensis]